MIKKCWLYLSRHAMTDLIISDVKEVPETKTAPEVFIDFLSQDFSIFFCTSFVCKLYISLTGELLGSSVTIVPLNNPFSLRLFQGTDSCNEL